MVNCDRSEEIGRKIQDSLDGKTFVNAKIKRNDKMVNLQSLCASIQLEEEKIPVNPLTLFLRLVTLVDRQSEKDISDCFQYELTSHPMSLFKNNDMREAAKCKLKNELVKNVDEAQNNGDLQNEYRVLDGGALLWVCDWKKGEKFEIILDRYVQKCKELHAAVVVFDGYESSTKAKTQEKRGKKVSCSVEISEHNKSTADRKDFFENYGNKECFIKILSKKLEAVGIEVIIANGDADTTIVKSALSASKDRKNQIVTIVSDDTDVLCLLLHHCSDSGGDQCGNIHLMDMKIGQKLNDQKSVFVMLQMPKMI